jgi:threonine aldolase
MHFASDNTSGVAPAVLDALARANAGAMPSYGADPVMDEVRARVRDVFEAPEAAVYLVATGTAANALALATFCPPWAAVYCHRHAHIEEDECGAPEFYTGGAKMVLIEGAHGKMDPDALHERIARAAHAGVHNVQRGMVSLTNLTEAGTMYTPAEVARICAIARDRGLPVHMDGARFANALVAAGCSAADMTWRAGVDVLSFGGTKNGLLGVEAVVIFDPARAREFELRRKRGGHLFSKHRYLSAQMQAYLADDLWLDSARAANARAAQMEAALAQVPGFSLMHPRQGNMLFVHLPRAAHARAMGAGAAYYFWPFDQSLEGPQDETLSARLVCSWNTTAQDIDRLVTLLKG